MQEKGWRAGAGKSGGDFAAYEAGLAHAGDDDAAFAGEEKIDGADEGIVEAREDVLDGLGFDAKNAAGRFEAHALLQRRTRVERSLRRARSWGSCARGRALGPSERAAAGLSWVSRKMPSTPVATPARASGSMNSGWPPLAGPWPPGSWTEWGTAETTGEPNFARSGEVFGEAGAAKGFDGRAVGFVVGGFENVGDTGVAGDFCDAFGHGAGVGFGFDDAWAGDEEERIVAAEAERA